MYKHIPSLVCVVKRQKQQLYECFINFFFVVVQGGLNVYLKYSGRGAEVFSGPTLESCSGACIAP